MASTSQSGNAKLHGCEYCQKEFAYKSHRNAHRKIHLVKTDFKCSFCDFVTNFKHNLFVHIRSHTKERPYKCEWPNCPAEFLHSTGRDQHINMVHKEESLKILKCSKCPYKTPKNSHLQTHLKSHSDIREFSCDLCSYRAKEKRELKRHHESVHLKLKPFKCQNPNCDSAFSLKGNLNRHQLVHNIENESLLKFKCSECDYKTGRQQYFKKHLAVHSEVRPFSCDLCPYRAKHKLYVTRHYNVVHLMPKPLNCRHPKCNSAFSKKNNLGQHQLAHNKDDDNIFKSKCSECDYKTGCQYRLKQHSAVHSEVKPFSCDLCPYRAKQRSSVKLHCKTVHSKLKSFKCPEASCSYSGKTKAILSFHMKVHSDYKEYTCAFPPCTYRSRWKANMNDHEMTHTGAKPFECKFCTFKCRRSTGLCEHIRRHHTGEAPYACKSCPYRGKSSRGLKAHVQRHHV